MKRLSSQRSHNRLLLNEPGAAPFAWVGSVAGAAATVDVVDGAVADCSSSAAGSFCTAVLGFSMPVASNAAMSLRSRSPSDSVETLIVGIAGLPGSGRSSSGAATMIVGVPFVE